MSNHTSPSTVHDSTTVEPTAAFLELSRIVVGSTPLHEVLELVAELAKRTIPGADEVSVSLFEGDRPRTVAFTGDVAVHLDERQYEADFGPCMDSAATGAVIEIPDTTSEERYPEFTRQARRAGVAHVTSMGMPIPQRTVGALNLYGKSSGRLDADALTVAKTFASYAAVALANASLYNNSVELARQMERAMASRAVIEQAKGMIMAREQCSAEEAFTVLTRASQHANRKLRDLAQDMVDAARSS